MSTTKELRKLCLKFFNYDAVSGRLTWKISKGAAKAGSIAGAVREGGYRVVRINKVLYRSHRIIWLMKFGFFPQGQIDHVDHDTSNNRMANLREVDHFGNLKNSGLSKRNKSGICGVYFNPEIKKWNAAIYHGGKQQNLGYFDNFQDAVAARKAGNKRFGFHPNHGSN